MINAYSPYSYPNQTNNRTALNQRKSLRWFLYLIILAAGGFGLSFYFSSLGEEYPVKVTEKEGGLEYRDSSQNSWMEPEKLPLEGKIAYEMRTLADGKAKISSDDGSTITMGNFARLILLKNQGEISWSQTDGEVRYLVEKNDKRKAFKIILSDGEISVLGTDLVVKVEEKDSTIYVFKGKVKVNYKDKSSQEAGENEKIIINPLEKKVVAFEEKDFTSPLRDSFSSSENKPAEPVEVADAPPIDTNSANENSNPEGNSNINNKNENQNVNPDNQESISVGAEKNENTNNQTATSSAVKKEDEPAPQPKTTKPVTSTPVKKNNSGVTTRSKCEDSGGHWTKDGSLCKCPPGENFTGGKCKRQ